MKKSVIKFIKDIFKNNDFIPLHEPQFLGNEKKYINNCIDSTFVSSVGKYVDEFEILIEAFTNSPKAVSTMNGTAALSAALYDAGVRVNDLVITQSLTFVATGNAIYHLGAHPIFIDISEKSLGLCPVSVSAFLHEYCEMDDDGAFHKLSGQRIRAIVPMHTYGHPCELDELISICHKWNITLIEDAAESLGSFYKQRHTGTIGQYGILSFNGNKTITTGGGGMVLCNSIELGNRVKHITTTAKVPHPYEFYHDQPGFNYRMPNINSALGCAQMEMLDTFLSKKRKLAKHYEIFFENTDFKFFKEPDYATSNYWLNTVICPTEESRDEMLRETNSAGIMTRPVWTPLHKLPMFKNSLRDDLLKTEKFSKLLINLPSSPNGDLL